MAEDLGEAGGEARVRGVPRGGVARGVDGGDDLAEEEEAAGGLGPGPGFGDGAAFDAERGPVRRQGRPILGARRRAGGDEAQGAVDEARGGGGEDALLDDVRGEARDAVGPQEDDGAPVGLEHGGDALHAVADGGEEGGGVGEGPVAGEDGGRVRQQLQAGEGAVGGGVRGVGDGAQRAGGQRARQAELGDGGVAAPQGLGARGARLGERRRAQRVAAQGVAAPDGAGGGREQLLGGREQAARGPVRAGGALAAAHDVQADVDGVGAGRGAGVEVDAGDDGGGAELDDVGVGPGGGAVPEAEAVDLEEEEGGRDPGVVRAVHRGARAALQVVAEPRRAGTEPGAAGGRVEAHGGAAAAGARDVGAGELEAAAEHAAAGVGELAVLVRGALRVVALGDAAGAQLRDLVAGEREHAGGRRRTRGADDAPRLQAARAARVGGGARELLVVPEEGDVRAPAARADGERGVLGEHGVLGGRDARAVDGLRAAVLGRHGGEDVLEDFDELLDAGDGDADVAQAVVEGLEETYPCARHVEDEVGDRAEDGDPEVVDDELGDLAEPREELAQPAADAAGHEELEHGLLGGLEDAADALDERDARLREPRRGRGDGAAHVAGAVPAGGDARDGAGVEDEGGEQLDEARERAVRVVVDEGDAPLGGARADDGVVQRLHGGGRAARDGRGVGGQLLGEEVFFLEGVGARAPGVLRVVAAHAVEDELLRREVERRRRVEEVAARADAGGAAEDLAHFGAPLGHGLAEALGVGVEQAEVHGRLVLAGRAGQLLGAGARAPGGVEPRRARDAAAAGAGLA